MKNLKKGDSVILSDKYKRTPKGLTRGKAYEVKGVSDFHFWIANDNGKRKVYDHYTKVFLKDEPSYTPGQMEVMNYFVKEIQNLEASRSDDFTKEMEEQFEKDIEFLKDKYLTMLVVDKQFNNE